MPRIQINYNKNNSEVVSWSEDLNNLNVGDIIETKIVELTDAEFEELKSPDYDKKYKDGISFHKKANVAIERQSQLVEKLKDNSITNKERDELLLLLVNKI